MIQLCQARLYVADYLAGKPLYMRHPKWDTVRDEHVAEFPRCAGCGTEKYPEAHHIWPAHLWPERELEKKWLLTMCGLKAHGCHFRLGHALNYFAFNPHVIEDCDKSMLRIRERRRTREALCDGHS